MSKAYRTPFSYFDLVETFPKPGCAVCTLTQRDVERHVDLMLYGFVSTDEMQAIALRHTPHAVCVVPEKREERTTEGGLEVAKDENRLAHFIAPLRDAGCRVSIFIAADRAQIEAAVRGGATAHLDPKDFPADRPGTAYMAPQVLTGVNHQMAVMVEESFGPVVGIMSVSDDEEAIGLMNDSQYGLTASLWTQDLNAAEQIGERLETGTVFMNRCDYLDPALAWTGVKDTGRGATLSRVGYETLTRPKSWHMRPSFAG